MNYIDKFKEMIALKDEIVFRPINQNRCNIYFANDDLMGIEQEVYYEFDDFGNYFEIYRVARGNKEKTASFKEDKYAYLYMGLQINKDLKSETNPIPEEIEYLNDERESNYEKLKQLISRYIDFSLFSVFELKNDAICLIADGGYYLVYYVDWRGNKNIIIDDEEEFGGGLQVMCNYAWTYQYVLEQVRDWDVDQNDAEYLYAVKKILRAG